MRLFRAPGLPRTPIPPTRRRLENVAIRRRIRQPRGHAGRRECVALDDGPPGNRPGECRDDDDEGEADHPREITKEGTGLMIHGRHTYFRRTELAFGQYANSGMPHTPSRSATRSRR